MIGSKQTIKIEDTTLIKTSEPVIAVTSPKLDSFVSGARKLGGKWDDTTKRWLFDPRDRAEVERLLYRCYGTTDSATASLCTLRVTLPNDGDTYDCSLAIAGRQIAKVWDRDGGAKLGDGIRIEAGKLFSGGSRKNPLLGWKAGTRILVRDVVLTAPRKVIGCSDAVVEQVEESQPAGQEMRS